MESFILERSWRELTMMGGQYLVYRLDTGRGSGLVFFDVLNNEIVSYDFAWAPVAAGANVPFFLPQQVVGGNISAEILEVLFDIDKGDDPVVSQVFHGFNQPLDRVRYRFPQPEPRGDLANTKITGPDLGTPFGWLFEGHESPFDNPTGRGMFFVLKGMSVEFGLEHRTDRIVTPSSNWIENNLQVRVLDPADDDDRAVMADILRGKKRAKYYSPGLQGVPFKEESMLSAYGVDYVHWDGKNATTKSGGVVI